MRYGLAIVVIAIYASTYTTLRLFSLDASTLTIVASWTTGALVAYVYTNAIDERERRRLYDRALRVRRRERYK